MLTSSFDSPIISAAHHFLPGMGNSGLSLCDATVANPGAPGTVSPSIDGRSGVPIGTFCQRSSAGIVSSDFIRSSGDLAASPKASTTFWYAPSVTTGGMGLKSNTAPPVLRQRFMSGSCEQRNIVTDTTTCKYGFIHYVMKLTPASAFAHYSDFIWISSETTNELLNPLQSSPLIMEAIVGLVSRVAKLF